MNVAVPQEKPSLRLLILAGSAIAAGIGFVALVGWIADIPRLTSFAPGLKPTAPDTALLFVLNGVALLLCLLLRRSRLAHFICTAAGSFTVVVALLLFCLSLLNVTLEIEHLGIPIHAPEAGVPSGHMSQLTALCFALMGISLLAALSASPKRPWQVVLARWLAGLVIMTGFVLFLTYILGSLISLLGSVTPPAMNSSLGLTALGSALFPFAGLRIGPLPDRIESAVPGASILVLVFAIMPAGITTAGYWYARSDENRYRAQVESGLSAVAELKVGELLQWRRERLGDGRVFHANANFSGLVRRSFEAPADRETQERLRTWLRQVQAAYQYDRVFLLDARGGMRMSVPETPEAFDSIIVDQASAALRMGEVVFQDFYRDEHDLRVYLAVLVPIRDALTSSYSGVLGLRIDPDRYLYSLINRWPTPSRSAETAA